MSTPVLWC